MLFHYRTQNDVPVHTAEILMSNWGLTLQCENRDACVYRISTYRHLIHWGWEPHFCVSMSHCHQQTAIVDGMAAKNFSKTKEMKGLVEHTCLHLYCGWAVLNTYKKKNLLRRHRPISLFGHHLTLCIQSTRQMPLHLTLLEAQREILWTQDHTRTAWKFRQMKSEVGFKLVHQRGNNIHRYCEHMISIYKVRIQSTYLVQQIEKRFSRNKKLFLQGAS